MRRMEEIVSIKTNMLWGEHPKPMVTITTSNFNRREVLLRCMKSVEHQTFRDIEYIVVDNGSTLSFDDIMENFMQEATIPVMFIKRSYGTGRHTGRNSATEQARGKYISMIDSDDEYLPNAIEILVKAWESIPAEKRDEYREVVGLSQDEYGKMVGSPFPNGINDVSKEKAFKIVQRPDLRYEHANMSRTVLLKENPFINPVGVTDSPESVIWWRLAKQYRSYFINDVLKIYYTESNDSISTANRKGITKNACISALWRDQYYLNHWDDYLFSFSERIKKVIYYNVWKNILIRHQLYPPYEWAKVGLRGFINNMMNMILWLPCKYATKWYLSTHEDMIE